MSKGAAWIKHGTGTVPKQLPGPSFELYKVYRGNIGIMDKKMEATI